MPLGLAQEARSLRRRKAHRSMTAPMVHFSAVSDLTMSELNHLDSRAWFLIFAHPGHELRAHHLLERTQPTVAVLTDGSGSTGKSRLDQTSDLLKSTGACAASVFGPLSDRDAYAALMAGDVRPFLILRDRLAGALRAQGRAAVLVDAAEGYNPIHDVCHWIGRAAVAQATRPEVDLELFELELASHPDGHGSGLRLALDDQAFARKLAAVERYRELAGEAQAAFEQHGREAFRLEFVRRVAHGPVPAASWVPHYEEVGESRVRSGLYDSVLRYAQHVRPVIDALLKVDRTARHAEDLRPLYQ